MKFIGRFAVVVLVVAIIVAGAVLWSHASGGNAGPRVPPPRVVEKFARIKADGLAGRPDTGLHLSNTNDLIRTCMIEAALAAFVVTISTIRRRERRMRRTA